MKKNTIILTILLVATFFCTNVAAQYEPPRHEASASIGLITHSDIVHITSDITIEGYGPAKIEFNDDDEAGIAFNFQYNRRFNKHIGVGGVFTYQTIKNSVYPNWSSASHEKIGETKSNYISIMPIGKLFWFDTKIFGMYTKLGAGLTILDREYEDFKARYENIISENEKNCFLALQVSPIGIEIGKDFRFFLEVGYGTEGLLNFGLELNL